ncbi:hypothetical protein ROBYS_40470 [Roseobacter sp. OBYS 0001]|nr:hypothetical protein ROBYS_40470 [Roseobacter sp. OBYS 0001]
MKDLYGSEQLWAYLGKFAPTRKGGFKPTLRAAMKYDCLRLGLRV